MITERANAKINVYLNVLARQENGYHRIESLMQTVSLCDLLTVFFDPSEHTEITLSVSGNGQVPTDCRNLAFRAAEKFLLAAGRTGHVHIRLEKHIPMAAGLAGGSTDAAAVLRAMNRLCGMPLPEAELYRIGAGLGADVPFCIRGGSARVGGIGERMEDAPAMPEGTLVVACAGEGVSTPWAYGELDRKYRNFTDTQSKDPRPETIERLWKAGDLFGSCQSFYNLFEEVVPGERPEVTRLKERMAAAGAVRAMMSGSGPSVFGVFRSVEDAERGCFSLREIGAAAYVCHPTGKYALR